MSADSYVSFHQTACKFFSGASYATIRLNLPMHYGCMGGRITSITVATMIICILIGTVPAQHLLLQVNEHDLQPHLAPGSAAAPEDSRIHEEYLNGRRFLWQMPDGPPPPSGYPVLFLLHATAQRADAWFGQGRIWGRLQTDFA
jgi:hypothetical protein